MDVHVVYTAGDSYKNLLHGRTKARERKQLQVLSSAAYAPLAAAAVYYPHCYCVNAPDPQLCYSQVRELHCCDSVSPRAGIHSERSGLGSLG